MEDLVVVLKMIKGFEMVEESKWKCCWISDEVIEQTYERDETHTL
jgi:hypothetical protein